MVRAISIVFIVLMIGVIISMATASSEEETLRIQRSLRKGGHIKRPHNTDGSHTGGSDTGGSHTGGSDTGGSHTHGSHTDGSDTENGRKKKTFKVDLSDAVDAAATAVQVGLDIEERVYDRDHGYMGDEDYDGTGDYDDDYET